MRRFLAALLGMLIGYPIFAFASYWAIGLFSSNHFDFGPAGAIIGLVAGAMFGKASKSGVTTFKPPSQT
jgi:hypothetical protein